MRDPDKFLMVILFFAMLWLAVIMLKFTFGMPSHKPKVIVKPRKRIKINRVCQTHKNLCMPGRLYLIDEKGCDICKT